MSEQPVLSFPNGEGWDEGLAASLERLRPIIESNLDKQTVARLSRGALAQQIRMLISKNARGVGLELNLLQERDLVTTLVNALAGPAPQVAQPKPANNARPAPAGAPQRPDGAAQTTPPPSANGQKDAPASDNSEGLKPSEVEEASQITDASVQSVREAAEQIRPQLVERIDAAAAASLPRHELISQINGLVGELLVEKGLRLNQAEKKSLVANLVNDMMGLGPLEPLLSNKEISEIMVNGPNQVYVEMGGKLTLTDVTFRDDRHLMNICTRIVSWIGRRVDESSPMCDARLKDGSRVNIIIPPLAIDGAAISIRKFSEQKITLNDYIKFGSISQKMLTVLQIAGRCKLNILISGGTGSGKTTLLNALSSMIDGGERVVTIEDAAELQLQQPHVVRLETRPANLEGEGEVTIRDLVKNALRMRPDRIILGECRGGEAIDMLQAMNTGHDGSMSTVHANNPREALSRLENMISMGGFNLPAKAMRMQIASAIDMICQVSRMRDGGRRLTHVSEVVGIEGDVITMQDLFVYKYKGEDAGGKLIGEFEATGVRPKLSEKASYFGLEKALLEALA
jgi:pilus assembly protein CpaF